MSSLLPQALVAPNIFDAYANPNLLLYLVVSNLLSPATWDLSRKILRRAQEAEGSGAPAAQTLIREIQTVIDRNFRHLQASEVVEIYGELDVSEERRRLGGEVVDTAMQEILRTFETRIEAGDIPREGLQPTIDRMSQGYFPAFAYGNIDLVRANRRLTGKSHASARGLTSCVDETAIFASLAMTMPKGLVANVVGLTSPSHSSAFGWNADGEAWWFYGKNRLFFAADWREHVAKSGTGNPQIAFDRLLSDAGRITSVAGSFDFLTGESCLVDAHVSEIVSKMDEFFGVRLRQVSSALSKPRVQQVEDPIAPILRELLGASSIEAARSRLESGCDRPAQDVLLAFRSLEVRDVQPYLVAARQQHLTRKLAATCSGIEDVIAKVAGIAQAPSILGSHDRITMPDETLRFRTGTDRDRALLLHVLAEHVIERQGLALPVETLVGETRCCVRIGGAIYDATTCQMTEYPSEPIRIRLGTGE